VFVISCAFFVSAHFHLGSTSECTLATLTNGAGTGEAVVRANYYAAYLLSGIELFYKATVLLAHGIVAGVSSTAG